MSKTDDSVRRDALARSLAARISDEHRTVDELRVLDVILTRIAGGGFDQYGGLVLARDFRDFRKEAAEEFADALWYMAADVVRRADERRERLECEACDRVEPQLRELAEHGLDHLFDTGGEG